MGCGSCATFASQVTFISIVLYTIQMFPKQFYSDKQGNSDSVMQTKNSVILKSCSKKTKVNSEKMTFVHNVLLVKYFSILID